MGRPLHHPRPLRRGSHRARVRPAPDRQALPVGRHLSGRLRRCGHPLRPITFGWRQDGPYGPPSPRSSPGTCLPDRRGRPDRPPRPSRGRCGHPSRGPAPSRLNHQEELQMPVTITQLRASAIVNLMTAAAALGLGHTAGTRLTRHAARLRWDCRPRRAGRGTGRPEVLPGQCGGTGGRGSPSTGCGGRSGCG